MVRRSVRRTVPAAVAAPAGTPHSYRLASFCRAQCQECDTRPWRAGLHHSFMRTTRMLFVCPLEPNGMPATTTRWSLS